MHRPACNFQDRVAHTVPANLHHARLTPPLQVLAAHEAVFTSIATTFASLATAVLPAYRLRLRKVGEAWGLCGRQLAACSPVVFGCSTMLPPLHAR